MLESDNNPHSLTKILSNIHRFSSIWINKNVNVPQNQYKVWHNYWDKCLTFESSYYARLNYIWHNPVKHKYVSEAQEFGSYYQRYQNERDYLSKLKIMYPSNGIDIEDDD